MVLIRKLCECVRMIVRGSARLAGLRQPGVAPSEQGVADIVARPRTRSAARTLASQPVPLLSAPHSSSTGSAGCSSLRCQRSVLGLRAVSVVLDRCDRDKSSGLLNAVESRRFASCGPREVRIVIDRCDAVESRVFANYEPREVRRVTDRRDAIEPSFNYDSSANATPPINHAVPCAPNDVVPPFSTTGIRILQLNMRRSAAVTGEVRSLIRQKRLDILLLQEPYVQRPDERHTFFGLGTSVQVAAVRRGAPWASVAVCNPAFKMLFISQLSTAHCVCAEVLAPGFSFYVVSHYFQFSDDIEEHLRHLGMVLHALRGKRVFISLDANARSSQWGRQETNERGARLERLIQDFGLEIFNDARQQPTFWTPRGESWIDVTLGTPSISCFVKEWNVRPSWSTSDHRAIDIRLEVPKAAVGNRGCGLERFNTRRADWDRFAEILTALSGARLEGLALDSAQDVEIMARTLTGVLTEACTESMPRKVRFRKSNPWWTAQLTNSKKITYRLMRAYRREQAQPERLVKLQEYRSSLRKYSREVRKAKRESWRKFVTSHGNSERWGFVYKHQADKLRVEKVLSTIRLDGVSTMDMRQTASGLLNTHVPDDREEEDSPWHVRQREKAQTPPDTEDAEVFTEFEVKKACRTLKNGKAPGPDLIEVGVLKAAVTTIPGQLVRLFNGCLRWGVFPSAWKEGNLCVLLKGEDKDEKDPKSYRPICLLSVIGKLFEKLIRRRLSVTMDDGGISRRQYGFMPGKSTEDAIVELRRMIRGSAATYTVALLFDIAGAFDNVWWPLVFRALRLRNCPANVYKVLQSYFDDRRVSIAWGGEKVSKRATKGCPQGSVLGPACWNLMFDSLLTDFEQQFPDSFIAYADDLLVLVKGESRREIEIEGQRVVDRIVQWSRKARLELSARKTEAILLKTVWVRRPPVGRRGGERPDRQRRRETKPDLARRYPTIRIGETTIPFKDSVRYLGVHFDKELRVSTHCRYLRDKVGSLFNKFGRLARAEWGLRFHTLATFYRGVFLPIVTYAAAGWSDLCSSHDLRALLSAQRTALIATTMAYRTASSASLCVIAGQTPLDILLEERRERYKIRVGLDARINGVGIHSNDRDAVKRIKEQGNVMWQDSWDASPKGRITYAFFRNIRDRLGAKWFAPDAYTTQVLSGHGNFRSRLASLGLADGVDCSCGDMDTVQHFITECQNFDPQRVALRDLIGDDQWPQTAHRLVATPEAYSVFRAFCRESLWLKGQEELAGLLG